MKSMIKKIVAVMAAVVMAVTAAVSVSADYLALDNYGVYNASGKSITVGSSLKGEYSCRWALSGLLSDYTYDCWIQFSFIDSIPDNYFISDSYYLTSNYSGYFDSSLSEYWFKLVVQLGSIERVSEKSFTVHLFWNSSVSEYYSATLYLAQEFFCNSGNIKWVGQGVGAYYDPGGDIYSQLIYEYGQGNPLPDVKDIKDQGAAMSTAEAAVRDKSSDLVSSVDSEWTGYQTDAKALATTLKPAATQINNLYATITAELPDEVKALFIAIPILLFIGWLIGRLRE